MRNNKLKLSAAFLLAALFAAPGLVLSYSLTGDSLGIGTSGNGYQRDFRVFNDFADGATNNNNNPDPAFPGALGAEQAIWKAGWAWNSDNPDAGKNFDFDWQGKANNDNSTNANTNSAGTASPCGGGVLAYTELPTSNGWRIIYCDQWTWSDGPGNPSGNQMDLQGIAAHEMGHALGMGHTQSGNCNGGCNGRSTMCAFVCSNGVSERTIEPDDANGLEAIYGSITNNKPEIDSLQGSTNVGGTLRINGSSFGLSAVRVKFTAGTTNNTGNIPGTVEVTPDTRQIIHVTVPSAAETGNVFVWKHNNNRLSNYFPITIGPDLPASCDGTVFGTPTDGTNGTPTIGLSNVPAIPGNDILELSASNFESGAPGFLMMSLTQSTFLYKTGTWFNVGFPLLFGFQPVSADGSGDVMQALPIPADDGLIGLVVYAQLLMNDSGGADGYAATEALGIEICDDGL